MKRMILAVTLVAVLAGSVFGGMAYAGASKGQVASKLVGFGAFGEKFMMGDTYREFHHASFMCINPNSEYDITIEEVVIFAANGTEVYRDSTDTTLIPHEGMLVRLDRCLPGQIEEPVASYIVEILWDGNKEGLSLIGVVDTIQRSFLQVADGEEMVAVARASMPMDSIREKP